MIIGKRLRARLDQLGITGSELARRVELSPRRIGHYLNDKREPDFGQLVKLCKELRTHPNYLFGFDDEPELVGPAGQNMDQILRELAAIKDRLNRRDP